MKGPKQEFIIMLETLSKTMQESAQRHLSMHTWYEKNNKHSCGYAACVLGDQALQGNYEVFPFEEKSITSDSWFLDLYSNRISVHLRVACRLALRGRFPNISDTLGASLAKSVYGTVVIVRKLEAMDSTLFTQKEVSGFRHLTEEYPTPEDARVYIDAVIQKVKEL
ncbi:hypothetical protein HOR87_gp10 [Marinomonas phage CB5A]|uniref:Uncharacterized protein n=3 Tax=Murciavirus TaxID=2731675 RepID=A0A1W5S0Y2_9CAUD|nr:hypothetical protein HOR72_gp07 [Marinomonas phage CPP1m]YP_009791099.1 hypothetical protein HOR87_gp10 [Marinomonas phage CB5A]ARB11226.1 hypothetical protein [Marinomonas phage CPP1m]ARB11276.1 hypothetical protein [Marinomonas phage CPG1g]ASP46264.1 hypothetical protein [Marinomonas phage CB5A]